MSKVYLYRRGDGNEGDFPRFMVRLNDSDNPYSALRALVANDYIAGKRVRRFIVANCEIDGEMEYGVRATVYEGPNGEQAFGSAWLTAQLEPLTPEDVARYECDRRYCDSTGKPFELRRVLDSGALKLYRKSAKRD